MYDHEAAVLALTDQEVLDLLAKVVATKPDHVYVPPVGTCMYFEPTNGWVYVHDTDGDDPYEPQGEFVPSCLVGHMLAAAGVSYDDLSPDNDEAITQLSAIDLEISPRAMRALDLAQKAQDGQLDQALTRFRLYSDNQEDRRVARHIQESVVFPAMGSAGPLPWRVAGEVAKAAMEAPQ